MLGLSGNISTRLYKFKSKSLQIYDMSKHGVLNVWLSSGRKLITVYHFFLVVKVLVPG